MKHNFSLENQITNGIVQYVEEIKTDLNFIQITFSDINKNKKTYLKVIGYNNLTITLDTPDDIVKSMEDITLYSMIGFSYEETTDGYIYCMKTDCYEIMFESKNFPSISD